MGEGTGQKIRPLHASPLELYGIIGHPVAHSLSPAMHNAAFKAVSRRACYVPFDVQDVEGAMRGVRALGIKGLSVTVPHKEAVMAYLDEIDPLAREIGACNTIINRAGRLLGTNTDWIGAVKAIDEVCPLKGKRVLVIGAGGSAKAIVKGLVREGARVHIANRTREKAEMLGMRFECSASGLDIPPGMEFDCLINATTVGMGADDSMPVAREVVEASDVVMDIVYSPLNTPLIETARALGKKVINGLRMLLFQAVAQFELWTGQKAPIHTMEQALKDAFYEAKYDESCLPAGREVWRI